MNIKCTDISRCNTCLDLNVSISGRMNNSGHYIYTNTKFLTEAASHRERHYLVCKIMGYEIPKSKPKRKLDDILKVEAVRLHDEGNI